MFLHNTSRVEDEPYPRLLQEKGFGGFPSLCFMDAEGNVVVKQGQRSVAAFESTRQGLQRLFDLRAEVAKGGKGKAGLEKKLLFAEIELQMLSPDEAKKRADKLTLDKDEAARLDQYLVGAEVRDLRARSRQLGVDEVASKIAAMAKAGKKPGSDEAPYFWQMALTHAAKTGDGDLGQQAFDQLKDLSMPARLKERFEAMLEQAKGGGK